MAIVRTAISPAVDTRHCPLALPQSGPKNTINSIEQNHFSRNKAL